MEAAPNRVWYQVALTCLYELFVWMDYGRERSFRQTGRQAEKQTSRETDTQTDKHLQPYTHERESKQTNKQAYKQTAKVVKISACVWGGGGKSGWGIKSIRWGCHLLLSFSSGVGSVSIEESRMSITRAESIPRLRFFFFFAIEIRSGAPVPLFLG